MNNIKQLIYKLRYWIAFAFTGLFITAIAVIMFLWFNINPLRTMNEPLDSLNGVSVYYNGGVLHHSGRNLTEDGYNLGLKYQCVEFIKRYYYEYYQHKMPDAQGNAVDFFDENIGDGELNVRRNLIQFSNNSSTKPKVGDILVFGGNSLGHVAIISDVAETKIEIIQQNAGPFGRTRVPFGLEKNNEKWTIKNKRILGWLRK